MQALGTEEGTRHKALGECEERHKGAKAQRHKGEYKCFQRQRRGTIPAWGNAP